MSPSECPYLWRLIRERFQGIPAAKLDGSDILESFNVIEVGVFWLQKLCQIGRLWTNLGDLWPIVMLKVYQISAYLVQRTEKRNVWRKKNASLNYIAGLWTLHIPPVLWDRTEMPTVHTHFSYLLRNGCEVPLIARENLDMPDPDRPDQHRLFHNNFTALHFAKPSELLL